MDDIFSKEFNDKISSIVDGIVDETESSLSSQNINEKLYYNDLLLNYLRRHGRSTEGDNSDIIPVSFELLDMETKIVILSDCLNNGYRIEKSKKYTSSLEGNFEPDFYQNIDRLR